MAKRRFKTGAEEKAPEDLTPEERRAQRRREKAASSTGRNRRGFGSPLRRGLLLGIPIAVIAIIVVVLYFNLLNFASPCLTLQTPPDKPYFPPVGTTDFAGTWCPGNNPTIVLAVQPLLHIIVNGTTVNLPAGIGINKSYGSFQCQLPVFTPTTAASLTVPGQEFVISSPWNYAYNLTWFFEDWQATYPTVKVDLQHASQPVTYTTTDLLGFTADKSHSINLFVDDQPSSAGPGLVLNTLDYAPSPFPACVATVYGTGHHILLSYGTASATAYLHGLKAPTLSTGPAGPDPLAQLWDGPGVHSSTLPPADGAGHRAVLSSMGFVFGRPCPTG